MFAQNNDFIIWEKPIKIEMKIARDSFFFKNLKQKWGSINIFWKRFEKPEFLETCFI